MTTCNTCCNCLLLCPAELKGIAGTHGMSQAETAVAAAQWHAAGQGSSRPGPAAQQGVFVNTPPAPGTAAGTTSPTPHMVQASAAGTAQPGAPATQQLQQAVAAMLPSSDASTSPAPGFTALAVPAINQPSVLPQPAQQLLSPIAQPGTAVSAVPAGAPGVVLPTSTPPGQAQQQASVTPPGVTPAVPPPAPGAGLFTASSTQAQAQQQAQQQQHSVLRGRRVLLVEDNLINQTVARKMLSGLGLVCEVGRQGLYLKTNNTGVRV
jgi:CheY-like chemotaxis protein